MSERFDLARLFWDGAKQVASMTRVPVPPPSFRLVLYPHFCERDGAPVRLFPQGAGLTNPILGAPFRGVNRNPALQEELDQLLERDERLAKLVRRKRLYLVVENGAFKIFNEEWKKLE